MKAASLSDLKKEMSGLGRQELLGLCLHLAKYKKENKELLSYLLFESSDKVSFVNGIKAEMDVLFSQINKSNLYLAKKGIRKILRIVQKNIKFSGSKVTETELLLYFCRKFRETGLAIARNKVLHNLYIRLLSIVEKNILALHEDLQADFNNELEGLKF